MRILLVTSEFPLPVNAGGVRRQLGLCEALAPHHDLHLLAREREPTTSALVDELRERLGAVVETFPPPAEVDPGPRAKSARWVRAALRRRPPWMITSASGTLGRRAAELAPAFDVAVILDGMAEVYVEPLYGRVPVVLDKHNVLGASWVTGRPWGSGPRGVALHRLVLWQTRAFERRNARLASGVVVSCDEEADRFQRLYGWRPHVVPSAIPPPRPVGDPVHAEPAVAWLGDHLYGANVDGLIRFARQAWAPLGQAGARLLIAGRQPPPRVKQLEQLPGVHVLGYVEDLDALLTRCAAAVAPLWAGAGIKMKTLTLMGAGLPVAGTPTAFEGIHVRHGHDALIAEDPHGLATALRRLLDNRTIATDIGRHARHRILTDHTWDTVIQRFEAALHTASLGSPPQPPNNRRFVESSSDG